MADGQRRAEARGDHQIVFAVEQKAECEGATQALQRFAGGLDGGEALVDQVAGELGHDLGIGFGFEAQAGGEELVAQLAEILDDAVVDHGDGAGAMGMGVGGGGSAMGGPAGVADAGLAGQRLVHQQVGEAGELAHGAAAVELSVV